MFMSQVPKAESSKTSKERQLTKGRAIQRAREGAPSAVVAALRGPVCGLYLSLSGALMLFPSTLALSLAREVIEI